MDVVKLKNTLNKYGQEHLLDHWDGLSDDEKQDLYQDLNSIDYEEMTSIFKRATTPDTSSSSVDERMRTIEDGLCGSVSQSSQEEIKGYEQKALEAVSRGEVGVLLLAGGQGTRLGVPYPKGMFDIGLPSHKTLYQIQAERILRLQRMARDLTGKENSIPMYIMTSEHTKAPTAEFFRAHDHFGLKEEDVVLFEQRMIPCFATDGKIILGSKTRVSRAPDGNGGLYWALKHEGLVDSMAARGVKYLHAYCVDNVLVKVADPVFVGFAISQGAESANKVVEKAFPSEAVGVVCRVDGKIQVVEYSEIGKEISEERNETTGKLKFCAGNICNHFFSLDFLRRVCDHHLDQLPHHVAKKKIPSYDGSKVNTPDQPNGIKLEKFVFDVFQFSGSFAVWECLREDEFSPLKNAEGAAAKDTPATAREALYGLHRRYVKRAGGEIVNEVNGTSNGNGVSNGDAKESVHVCEISPLVSYAGEGLEELVKGKRLQTPVEFK